MNKLSLLALVLCGCGPSPTQQMMIQPASMVEGKSERFTVNRAGVFEDDLAYGNKRGIYLIKDNKTGDEFVGISGVGVSQLGSHKSGKTTITDER